MTRSERRPTGPQQRLFMVCEEMAAHQSRLLRPAHRMNNRLECMYETQLKRDSSRNISFHLNSDTSPYGKLRTRNPQAPVPQTPFTGTVAGWTDVCLIQ